MALRSLAARSDDATAQPESRNAFGHREARGSRVYFGAKTTQDQLYQALAPVVERARALPEAEQRDFRGHLTDYVRLYAFLAQVLTFADADLERLYGFARHLRRLLPADREELSREVQQNIDMESYRIEQTGSGRIALERKAGLLDPASTKSGPRSQPEELEALSRIIAELTERFGLNLGPEHRLTLGHMMERLDADPGLDASARVNTRENVRLTFDQKVEHAIQDIVDSNFELYRRITDDPAFGAAVKNFLFDQYLRAHRQAEELIKRGESKTLEFKSTLRWSLKDGRQDYEDVTHAVLKTVAAFLNTEGGDLLIGVADDGVIVGIEHDQLETDDKFMRRLAQVVRNGLGDRARTCIDRAVQIGQGRTVCVVSCPRSPEPVFLKWKGVEASPGGDFYVRSGPGNVRLAPAARASTSAPASARAGELRRSAPGAPSATWRQAARTVSDVLTLDGLTPDRLTAILQRKGHAPQGRIEQLTIESSRIRSSPRSPGCAWNGRSMLMHASPRASSSRCRVPTRIPSWRPPC